MNAAASDVPLNLLSETVLPADLNLMAPGAGIRLGDPELPPLAELLPLLQQIWAGGHLSNNGPQHLAFEASLRGYLGVDQLSLYNNASTALMAALRTLGRRGEIITTPFSFVATANAIDWAGFTPVFADIDPVSLNLCPVHAEALITRTRTATDNATPAGNGVIAQAYATLYMLTGEDVWRRKTEALAAAFTTEIARTALAAPSLLGALDMLARGVQVVIVGRRGDPASDALIAATFAAPLVNRAMSVVTPGGALPDGHPATGKTQQDGTATAYVCVGPTCTLPITDAAILAEQLSIARQRALAAAV